MISQMMKYTVDCLTEGIIVIGFNGTILYANPAASAILCIPGEKLTGEKFINVISHDPQNDDFLQAIMDVISKRKKMETVITPFFNGEKVKHLRMSLSILMDIMSKPLTDMLE